MHLCAGTPHFSRLIFAAAVSYLYRTVPQVLKLSTCGSHGTTAVAHQLFLLRRPRTMHLCVRVPRLQGAGQYKPTLPPDFKSNRAATVTTTAAVQQRQRFKLWLL